MTRQLKLVRSRLVFGLPKNDHPRRIPLPDTAAEVLRRHMETYLPVTVTLPWEDPAAGAHQGRHRADQGDWSAALRHFYASALLDARPVTTLADLPGRAEVWGGAPGSHRADSGAVDDSVSFPVMSGLGPLVVVLVYAVGLAAALVIPYWVIRLAVRHALMDADDRRARAELEAAP